MRATEAAIVERLDALITKGEDAAHTAKLVEYVQPPSYRIDHGLYANWWTQSVHTLTNVLGESNNYTRAFVDQVQPNPWREELETGLGILRAVREDAAAGHLFMTVAGLISAEIFSDFLEMADHLFETGYLQPAASLIGAVLEDTLRRAAQARNLPVKEGDDISSLNQRLAQANAYNRVVRSQIQTWKVIRDAADHGRFGDLGLDQVRDMHGGVKAFVAEHVA